MHQDPEKYLSWFIFRQIPLLGNLTCKTLIHKFKSPDAVFAATDSDLLKIKGVGRKSLRSIRSHSRFRDPALNELEKVDKTGAGIATLVEDHYPDLLKQIHDPPPVITYKGSLISRDTSPCISIVGSRRASHYGLNTASHLSGALSRMGFTIVSGMAKGIDSAAHKGALDSGKRTIAVLGSGLNRIYPRENRALFSDICKNGAVLSEFFLDTEPFGRNFPIRNRIIAGMSTGTLVVEAEKKSGSLITARLAAEYNREVFAVPGSVKSQKSQGTHALLKQGARLVENEMDVLDELGHFVHVKSPGNKDKGKKNMPVMDKFHGIIYKMLDPYPRHIDWIVNTSKLESAKVASVLLELELKGLVLRHPGNFYSISEELNWQNP